jgi:hypothetical protein
MQQNHWALPLSTQPNDCLIRRHAPFYYKNDFNIIRKEEEREGEIRPSRQETDHYKNINL